MIIDPVPDFAPRFFAALADPTRLRALMLIAAEGGLCVCELTAALEVSQPKMSRHLAALREIGLLADRRAATRVFYHIHPGLPGWAAEVVRMTAAGIGGGAGFAADRTRLHAMPNRPPRRAAA